MKNMSSSIKTYSELIIFHTFEERLNYLRLYGTVGYETFGFDRYINQMFYKSAEWKHVKREVILRDNCCDLGLPGHEIMSGAIIHHMVPLKVDDIVSSTEILLNPDYLITVSHRTHNLIHYGDDKTVKASIIAERKPFDTCPWRK